MKHAISNKSINLLNLHYGLFLFALAIAQIFIGVYFYQIGLTLVQIYLTFACILILRLSLRIFSLKLINIRGLRKSVLLGTLCQSCIFIMLGQVKGVDGWLAAFVIVYAIADVLYWLPYHTYYSMVGDSEHRGKQIGVRESVKYVALFLAPITGGVCINFFGFWSAFFVATTFMLIASIPLLKTPEVEFDKTISFKEAWESVSKVGGYLFIGIGIFVYSYDLTWPLILFIFLDDYIAFGGLLSLVVLFQVIGSLWIGHRFDEGDGKIIYQIGLLLISMGVIGRSYFAFSIPIIIFLDILFVIGSLLYLNTLFSAYYNVSKKSKHTLWFQFFSESGFDIGGIIACSLAIIILTLGADLRDVMLIAFIGILIIGNFLKSYFANKYT